MNLLNQSEFAKLAGVSRMAISLAIKDGRVSYYHGTKKIDPESPLAVAYLNTINPQRFTGDSKPKELLFEPSKQVKQKLEETAINNATLRERYEAAKTGKEEQQEEKLALANATRRAELFESKLVNERLMTFLDRQRNFNKRGFSQMIDDIWNAAQSETRQKVEVKRECMQKFDEWYFEATHGLADKMQEIEEDQATA